MLLDNNALPSMEDFDPFRGLFEAHAKEIASKALLRARVSLPRLRDAYYAWRDDLLRLEDREKKLKDGADHFKQCANLAYWLRRMSPVVEYQDIAALVEDVADLYPNEKSLRDLLSKYGSEFIAFDFGFQVCQYYELERKTNPAETLPKLNRQYIVDVCHMITPARTGDAATRTILRT